MKTSKHPKLANGQPAISCYAMSQPELVRRLDLAHARAEALARQQAGRDDAYLAAMLGRHVLWHTEFPLGWKLTVCDCDLFRLTADLPSSLLEMNGGQVLNFFDYGYLADLLREELTNPYSLESGDQQNVRRALAWVEEQGSMQRDYSKERD